MAEKESEGGGGRRRRRREQTYFKQCFIIAKWVLHRSVCVCVCVFFIEGRGGGGGGEGSGEGGQPTSRPMSATSATPSGVSAEGFFFEVEKKYCRSGPN